MSSGDPAGECCRQRRSVNLPTFGGLIVPWMGIDKLNLLVGGSKKNCYCQRYDFNVTVWVIHNWVNFVALSFY